jgi:flagellin
MGLRINTNIASIAAQRALKTTTRSLQDSYRKLSTGERITRAADDAAGLAISENLKAQIRSFRQAKRNAEDGISLVQVAEGALTELSSMVIRLRELGMQASSDTVGDTERRFADLEFQALKEEMERISHSSEFNSTKLLDGTGGYLEFQVGSRNNPTVDRIGFDASEINVTLGALGLADETIAMKSTAQTSLASLDDALYRINGARAKLGAIQNRLTSTANNLDVNDENYSAANSRIRDADMATESAELARNNVLAQSGTSVLAQANQTTGFALKLLAT